MTHDDPNSRTLKRFGLAQQVNFRGLDIGVHAVASEWCTATWYVTGTSVPG